MNEIRLQPVAPVPVLPLAQVKSVESSDLSSSAPAVKSIAPVQRGSGSTRQLIRHRATKTYDAALTNRLTADWQAPRTSADAELSGRLQTIRGRSRELEQNDPYGENFLRLAENNVIGHAGITLQMKIAASISEDPVTGEIVRTLSHRENREVERGWKRFCTRGNYLTTRNRDATAADKLILRTILRDGDCLIRKVRGYDNEFGFALQLLEADYLDDMYTDFRGVPCRCEEEGRRPCQRGMHEIRMGVELHGDWKYPVAYWLLAHHPGDYFYTANMGHRRMRVPVDEIIHPFIAKRIEQSRGVPAMVSAMLRLQMLGGYIEAELVAARCAAQKMGFLEKEIPDSIADTYFNADTMESTIDSEPGQIEELPVGVKFKAWDPDHPNGNMPGFNKEMLRGYGAGAGVSYTALANDIENVNFSSIRAGLLEEREVWKSLQTFFISDVKMEIFRELIPMAILSGQMDIDMSRIEDVLDPEAICFKGRRWPWVDPQKDVEAAKAAIELGIQTRSEVIAERGGDFEEVTAELARENEVRASSGLNESEDPEELKRSADVYGVAVRAGAITPQTADEKHFRSAASLPAMSQEAQDAWSKDNGIRRPVTLAVQEGAEVTHPIPPAAQKCVTPEVKSAFLGEVLLATLPEAVIETIGNFITAPAEARAIRYQMTVPELLDKADPQNLGTARKHVRRVRVIDASDEVHARQDKFLLILNDRIIDGHHFLAKAERGKVTRSLPVVDLTPLRFQGGTVKEKTLDPADPPTA